MRVLVTGGSGKIGRHVLREFAAAKHELLSVDRTFAPPGEQRVCRTVIADLANAGEVYDALVQFRPEVVCHLAANPNPVSFPRQQIFSDNVQASYNVMQAAGDLGVRRLISCSSVMAGTFPTDPATLATLPLTEASQYPPTNAYGMSKRVGETIADSMAARYPSMAIVSLRPTYVVFADGYGELVRRRDKPSGIGSEVLWTYVDVRDCASAFRAAAEGVSVGHEICLISARDHTLDISLAEAFTATFKTRAAIDGDREAAMSSMDCSKMQRLFGWTAKNSWRDQRTA